MEKLEKLYEGKAKQLYATDDPEVLWVEYKNSATAGDGEKKEDFAGKGRLNNLITTLIFAFIMCWNEFTFALILTDNHTRTLQIALYSTMGYRGIIWEQMAAAGMIIMVPMFILSFLIRRYFIEGITMGAVK